MRFAQVNESFEEAKDFVKINNLKKTAKDGYLVIVIWEEDLE